MAAALVADAQAPYYELDKGAQQFSTKLLARHTNSTQLATYTGARNSRHRTALGFLSHAHSRGATCVTMGDKRTFTFHRDLATAEEHSAFLAAKWCDALRTLTEAGVPCTSLVYRAEQELKRATIAAVAEPADDAEIVVCAASFELQVVSELAVLAQLPQMESFRTNIREKDRERFDKARHRPAQRAASQ